MFISHKTGTQDLKVLTTKVFIRNFTKNTPVISKYSSKLIVGLTNLLRDGTGGL